MSVFGEKCFPLMVMLALAAAAVTSDRPCFPGCQRADWSACMGDITESNIIPPGSTVQAFCLTCNATPTLLLEMTCLNDTPRGFAVRGRPLHVLSDLKPPHFCAARVAVLGLIDGNITDVDMSEYFLVSGYTNLLKLALNSNNLTHVRRSWFKGLETLSHLSLSNNQIDKIEPGCFADLPRLVLLNLDNNLLHAVEADWFPRSHKLAYLYLSSNRIDRVPADTLHNLEDLSLGRNPLSCLNNEAVCGLDNLRQLYMSGNRMVTMYGGTSSGVMWSLVRKNDFRRGDIVRQRISFEVPHLLLCLVHDPDKNEQSLKWMFAVSPTVPRHTTAGFPDSCSVWGDSLTYTEIIRQPPFVVVAGVSDENVQNHPEQCREMWERDGLAVELKGGSSLNIVSVGVGDHALASVAMMVGMKPRKKCPVRSQSQTPKQGNQTTWPSVSTHVFTTPPNSDHSTPSPGHLFLLECYWLLPVSVTAVGVLLSVALTACYLLYKRRLNNLPDDNIQVWVIPDGMPNHWPKAASLPLTACTTRKVRGENLSRLSLPAVLHTIEPTYSEIPDDIAAAHRPLPALPHTYSEIPDAATFGLVRSASFPPTSTTHGDVTSGGMVHMSLPSGLHSIEPTYSEIPDAVAAAWRPLPSIPRANWESQDDVVAPQSLPSRPHTYSEIPDDRDSGPVSVLAHASQAGSEVHAVRNRGRNRLSYQNNVLSTPRRYIPTYGTARLTKARGVALYNCAEVQGVRGGREPKVRGLRHHGTPRRVSLPTVTLPNTYWPWEIPGEGTRNTPRRASLPTVTLPNTYWPWEIQEEGTRHTARRASLPAAIPPNTYWPWEIPGEGTCNTPQPVPLPLGTLPNTYWPWEISGEGTHNTPRRASLPTVTLPNTYWPWDIPGEGTINSAERALPLTLPNTYWPWEIPGEGTRNTARRSSLPIVTPPNTYWPWDIPGEGTLNSAERALPLTLPNTYWPWEIPGEGTRNTARRSSLPIVTLPNTYSPRELPGEGTCNTPQPVPLPTVTLPNTYWPWEIPGEGIRNTSRRASLPTVTLPNTYWSWEIPGEGIRNTPRRASLPTVTLPNTYWSWEIPGEGIRNTPRRASLPTVTLPNTYWPWEIPGEGIRNTPRRASLPTVTLPNTYWPWEIPGEGTRNTSRRASLPTVTLPNTYWPWEIPGEGTHNTARRASLSN
ncbi:hypothetical protein Bbelb_116250 [Branchiostoma belcheri]|nr:hypothetical protein Bbelb_116250 [Branchiostoma belcheri]